MSHITREREARECKESGMPFGDYMTSEDKHGDEEKKLEKEVHDLRNKLGKLTDLMFEVCIKAEENSLEHIMFSSLELKTWWSNYQEDSAIRVEEEKKNEEAAYASAISAVKYMAKYVSMIGDTGLSSDDRVYFSKKVEDLEEDIVSHVKRFPDIYRRILETLEGSDNASQL